MKNEKPSKNQIISALENLSSSMNTVSILVSKYGRKDKASELMGAAGIVDLWINELKKEK